jgi:hypothetical protein
VTTVQAAPELNQSSTREQVASEELSIATHHTRLPCMYGCLQGPLPPTRQRPGDSSCKDSKDQGPPGSSSSGAHPSGAGAKESGGGLLGLTEWGVDDFGGGSTSGRGGSPGRPGARDQGAGGQDDPACDEGDDPWPEGWPLCCCQYRQVSGLAVLACVTQATPGWTDHNTEAHMLTFLSSILLSEVQKGHCCCVLKVMPCHNPEVPV